MSHRFKFLKFILGLFSVAVLTTAAQAKLTRKRPINEITTSHREMGGNSKGCLIVSDNPGRGIPINIVPVPCPFKDAKFKRSLQHPDVTHIAFVHSSAISASGKIEVPRTAKTTKILRDNFTGLLPYMKKWDLASLSFRDFDDISAKDLQIFSGSEISIFTLRNTKLRSDAYAVLGTSKNLVSVGFENTGMKDDDFEKLSKLPYLKFLTIKCGDPSEITNKILPVLRGFSLLTKVKIENCALTAEEVAELQKSLDAKWGKSPRK